MSLPNKLRALSYNLKFANWPLALLQRAIFRRENLVVYRMGGVTFLVDFEGGDQCGTRECLVTDMYPRYYPHLPKNRPLTVLDLGGNGGGFPLSLIASGFALGTCVSIEMNPNTFTRLQFNARYNDRHHWQSVNAAVSARNGSIELDDTKGGTNESIYASSKAHGSARIEVPLMTFDEIVSKHFVGKPDEAIDVCKMDVEGAEYEVLLSETCQAIRRVRYLIIEIHSTGDQAELTRKILSYGFEEIDANIPNDAVHFFRNTKMGSTP